MARADTHPTTPSPAGPRCDVYRVATTSLEYENISLEQAAGILEIDPFELAYVLEEHSFCGTEYHTAFEHVPLVNSPSLRIAGIWLMVGIGGLVVSASLLMW